MNDWSKHSLRLNIRGTSPSPVREKQPTSYLRGKKNLIMLIKREIKKRKGLGALSKKYN